MAVDFSRLNSSVRDKLGVDVIYTPDGGSPRTVKAIVDQDYVSETVGIGHQTESMVLNVVDADLPELAVDDRFEVNATAYKVVEVRPDYVGMSDIVLNKV